MTSPFWIRPLPRSPSHGEAEACWEVLVFSLPVTQEDRGCHSPLQARVAPQLQAILARTVSAALTSCRMPRQTVLFSLATPAQIELQCWLCGLTRGIWHRDCCSSAQWHDGQGAVLV